MLITAVSKIDLLLHNKVVVVVLICCMCIYKRLLYKFMFQINQFVCKIVLAKTTLLPTNFFLKSL